MLVRSRRTAGRKLISWLCRPCPWCRALSMKTRRVLGLARVSSSSSVTSLSRVVHKVCGSHESLTRPDIKPIEQLFLVVHFCKHTLRADPSGPGRSWLRLHSIVYEEGDASLFCTLWALLHPNAGSAAIRRTKERRGSTRNGSKACLAGCLTAAICQWPGVDPQAMFSHQSYMVRRRRSSSSNTIRLTVKFFLQPKQVVRFVRCFAMMVEGILGPGNKILFILSAAFFRQSSFLLFHCSPLRIIIYMKMLMTLNNCAKRFERCNMGFPCLPTRP